MYEGTKGGASPDSAKFLQSMGMKIKQTPLVSITASLDIIWSRPVDVAHLEYAGIANRAQYALFAAVLTDALAFASCERSIG